MKKLITCVAVCLAIGSANAQVAQLTPQVFASSGGYSTNTQADLALSFTIGEPMVTTLTDIKLILTQGFQQPLEGEVSVNEFAAQYGIINIYPNPFDNEIYVSVDTDKQYDLVVYATDMAGRLVAKSEMGTHYPGKKEYNLSTTSWAQGVYTLTVASTQGNFVKTLKLNKIN